MNKSRKHILKRVVSGIMAFLFLLAISIACFNVVIPFAIGFILQFYVRHFTKNWPTNEAFPNTHPLSFDISVLIMCGLTIGYCMIEKGSWIVGFAEFPHFFPILICSELGVVLAYLLQKTLDQNISPESTNKTRLRGQPLDTPRKLEVKK